MVLQIQVVMQILLPLEMVAMGLFLTFLESQPLMLVVEVAVRLITTV